MNGYFLFRRDRTAGIGGGVMAYISNKICVRIPNLLTKNAFDFEILWLLLRPCLLPRPLSIVILAIVYCPPWYNVEKCQELSNYIVQCVDELSKAYSNPCILIVGDFNALDCSRFNKFLSSNSTC